MTYGLLSSNILLVLSNVIRGMATIALLPPARTLIRSYILRIARSFPTSRHVNERVTSRLKIGQISSDSEVFCDEGDFVKPQVVGSNPTLSSISTVPSRQRNAWIQSLSRSSA